MPFVTAAGITGDVVITFMGSSTSPTWKITIDTVVCPILTLALLVCAVLLVLLLLLLLQLEAVVALLLAGFELALACAMYLTADDHDNFGPVPGLGGATPTVLGCDIINEMRQS